MKDILSTEVDFIIVGQGLSGSLLAYQLQKRGQRLVVIDNNHHQASSSIAAGLINPVTGRRFVKTWMFDTLMAYAEPFYREMEGLFQQSLFQPQPILKVFLDHRDETSWLVKSGDPQYRAFLKDRHDFGSYEHKIENSQGVGELLQTAQVKVAQLIDCFQKHFRQEGQLLEEVFDYELLQLEASEENGGEKMVRYKNYRAKKIVFCEGYKCVFNPYFQYLPFELAKGEVLLVDISNIQFEEILKHKLFIVPQGNSRYWIGSTYERDFEDEQATPAGRQYLTGLLTSILKVPFRVVDHQAAIRPTVMDRRPFLGTHPETSQLSVFNGMGAKGASLIPYWSDQMAEYLLHGKPLHPEVDIQRFFPWHKHVFPLNIR